MRNEARSGIGHRKKAVSSCFSSNKCAEQIRSSSFSYIEYRISSLTQSSDSTAILQYKTTIQDEAIVCPIAVVSRTPPTKKSALWRNLSNPSNGSGNDGNLFALNEERVNTNAVQTRNAHQRAIPVFEGEFERDFLGFTIEWSMPSNNPPIASMNAGLSPERLRGAVAHNAK